MADVMLRKRVEHIGERDQTWRGKPSRVSATAKPLMKLHREAGLIEQLVESGHRRQHDEQAGWRRERSLRRVTAGWGSRHLGRFSSIAGGEAFSRAQ